MLQISSVKPIQGPEIFDFYRDIRTYGRGQEELYEQAAKNKVLFLRFEAAEAPVVTQNGGSNGHPLSIMVQDTLTFGEEVEVPVDLVVLAVGVEPNNVSDLAAMMKLPVGADRFLQEVHPKLRPVELSVAGGATSRNLPVAHGHGRSVQWRFQRRSQGFFFADSRLRGTRSFCSRS